MKAEDIITYAEAKKIPYEVHGACTSLRFEWESWGNFLPCYDYRDLIIGFEFRKDVWYWFKFFSCNDEIETAFFIERYNRVNGASQKSFRKGWDCEREVIKFLEKLNK